MARPDYIDWLGESGRTYRYWFNARIAKNDFLPVAANYTFVGLIRGIYLPIYFGEAEDISDRIPGHEKWLPAIRLGATDVMSHSAPNGVAARLAEERDLIRYWNPVLNVQHRSTGLLP